MRTEGGSSTNASPTPTNASPGKDSAYITPDSEVANSLLDGIDLPEPDLSGVEALYGRLNEVHDLFHEVPPDQVTSYQGRYHARRNLADFATWPEGETIQVPNAESGGDRREVVLITPPDMIAVRNEDGSWFRRLRTARDGTAPYNWEWYNAYLRTYGLPSYFLTIDHINMTEDESEARVLGMYNWAYATVRHPFEDDITEQRFPGARYPAAMDYGGDRYYNFTNEDLRLMYYWCPAVQVQLDGWYIITQRSGRIVFRRGTQGAAIMGIGVRPQWSMIPPPNVLTSYHNWTGGVFVKEAYVPLQLGSRLHQDARHDTRAANDDRNTALADAYARGGVVNPDHHPNGEGHWEYLRDVDDQLAQSIGMLQAGEVMLRRENGVEDLSLIDIVWYPNEHYLNPTRELNVPGHWEFLTWTDPADQDHPSDLAHANMNIPNNERAGLLPTAQEVWYLRQRERRRYVTLSDEEFAGAAPDGVTTGINLVWVPGTGQDETENSHQASPGDRTNDNIGSSIWHPLRDPTNGGDAAEGHNQTGDEKAQYHTQTFTENGQNVTVTVDRSRAHAGNIQPHKLWIYGVTGWRQHPLVRKGKFDWNDKAHIERLNSWREQESKRGGWVKKRTSERRTYEDNERDFIWEFVKQGKGRRPNTRMPEIARQFNQRFAARGAKAIESFMQRLMDEYKKFGAGGKPKVWRGHNKQKEAQERKRKAMEAIMRTAEKTQRKRQALAQARRDAESKKKQKTIDRGIATNTQDDDDDDDGASASNDKSKQADADGDEEDIDMDKDEWVDVHTQEDEDLGDEDAEAETE